MEHSLMRPALWERPQPHYTNCSLRETPNMIHLASLPMVDGDSGWHNKIDHIGAFQHDVARDASKYNP